MEKLLDLLSKPEEANIVIQTLASYVVYIYPGIISIYLFDFFNARSTKHTQAFLVKSFSISYLYNICTKTILKRLNPCLIINSSETSISYNIFLLFFSLIVPYIWYKFLNSKLFSSICAGLKINTSVNNIPFDLLEDEEENYTCMKVYIKDSPYVYIGYIAEHEYEDGRDKYIILTGYKKYKIKANLSEHLLVDNKSEDYREKIFIKLDEIKLIEKISEKRARKEIYQE